MQITARELKLLIRKHLLEASEEEHIPFEANTTMELIRPVRVTPLTAGGFEGGEDSPGARRPSRPRGTTAAILPPGTKCRILKAGKNDAVCQPLTPEGDLFFNPQTDTMVDRVRIHINKFCPHCAGVYKAGRGQRQLPADPAQPAARAPVKAAPKPREPIDLSKIDDLEFMD